MTGNGPRGSPSWNGLKNDLKHDLKLWSAKWYEMAPGAAPPKMNGKWLEMVPRAVPLDMTRNMIWKMTWEWLLRCDSHVNRIRKTRLTCTFTCDFTHERVQDESHLSHVNRIQPSYFFMCKKPPFIVKNFPVHVLMPQAHRTNKVKLTPVTTTTYPTHHYCPTGRQYQR